MFMLTHLFAELNNMKIPGVIMLPGLAFSYNGCFGVTCVSNSRLRISVSG